MEYIDSSNNQKINENIFEKQPETCIFCDYAKSDKDDENLILLRGDFSYALMNRYPYSVGHLLITTYRHTSDLLSLSDEEKLEIFTLSQKSVSLLKTIMNTDGFNIGMNLGKIAGAGINTHLHLHVVPRWNGDINFMSVTAETKVLPEALSVTRRKILDHLNSWDNQ